MAATTSPIEENFITTFPSHQPTHDQISTTQQGQNNTQFPMDVDAYLQQLSDQNARLVLPELILIGILSIIGTIGNSMIIYIYITKFKPSSTRSAIVALASFDLVASCLSMPGEIIVLRFAYNFPSVVLCKVNRVSMSVTVLASFFTLMVLTHDRYRKICYPTTEQLTVEKAKKRILLCLLAAVVFSVPAVFVYGFTKNPAEISSDYSTFCDYDNEYKSFMPMINVVIHTILMTVVVVTIFVLYGLIARAILRQRKIRQAFGQPKRKEYNEDPPKVTVVTVDIQQSDASMCSLSSDTNMDATHDDYCHPHGNREQEITTEYKKNIFPRKKTTALNKASKSSKGYKTITRKTTRMLFIITIVFIASFIPYVTLHSLILSGKLAVKSLPDIPFSGILTRSFFVNSVTNCFIFGFCCPKFKRESKRGVMKLFQCFKMK